MSKRKPLSDFLSQTLGKMSQTKLAESLGVSRSTVGRWARGQSQIPETARRELRRGARGGKPAPIKAKETKVQGGGKRVETNRPEHLGDALKRATKAKARPDRVTIRGLGVTGKDSPKKARKTDRTFTIENLSDSELDLLAQGSKDSILEVIRGRTSEMVEVGSIGQMTFTTRGRTTGAEQ